MVHVDLHDPGNMQLIAEAETKRAFKPRYISKYRPLVQLEYSKGKYSHRTFGVPAIQQNNHRVVTVDNQQQRSKKVYEKPELPKSVRRKKEKEKKSKTFETKVSTKTPKSNEEELPELPKDPFKTALVNYMKENVVKAKQMKPPEPKKRTVHTRFGDTFDLISSGLYPVYIRKKGYGKVPKTAMKTDRAKLTAAAGKEDGGIPEESSALKEHCRCITAQERDELLQGMKKRWSELMMDFQRLPFVIDTPPKAQRKTQMERDLDQLEKDIDTIERHTYIYVYSDNEE